MQENNPINLDENIYDHFDFIVNGITYRCTYPTPEDAENFQKKNKKNKDNGLAFVYELIKPVNDNDPEFKETFKKMITPKQVRFMEMLKAELGVEQ